MLTLTHSSVMHTICKHEERSVEFCHTSCVVGCRPTHTAALKAPKKSTQEVEETGLQTSPLAIVTALTG